MTKKAPRPNDDSAEPAAAGAAAAAAAGGAGAALAARAAAAPKRRQVAGAQKVPPIVPDDARAEDLVGGKLQRLFRGFGGVFEGTVLAVATDGRCCAIAAALPKRARI